MVSTLVILGIFFVPAALIILIVWFKSSEKRKRYELQADLYVKALEKGQPIPDGLFVEPPKPKKRFALNTGIICIAAGIGIVLCFRLMSVIIYSSNESVPFDNSFSEAFNPLAAMALQLKSRQLLSFASLGIIPFLIGVAFIIIHFTEKEQVNNEDAK